jgi:hypothetical protein
VTEVFAVVLRLVPDLRNWFLQAAQMPPPRGEVQVETQNVRGGAGRPDMVLDYFDFEQKPRRLISEHKLDADLTSHQLDSYPEWSRDKLVLVAPQEYRQTHGFDSHLTWGQVGQAIEELGRRVGRRWREAALAPEAPSWLRLLLEFLVLLERQNVGVDMPEPVALMDVLAFRRASLAQQKLTTLLELIRLDESLRRFDSVYEVANERRELWYFMLDQPWPLLSNSNPEYSAQVSLWPSDSHELSWVPEGDRLGEPFLSAGYWFMISRDQMPPWLDDASVRAELARLGVLVGRHPNGRQGKCEAVLYISDLVSRGRSLRDQAKFAASWVVERIEGISAISLA